MAAMLAFAGNSLLCRWALRETAIDPASFAVVRLVSGAAALALLVRPCGVTGQDGNWRSAIALFAYAAAFSFAYVQLSAAVGALLLFGVVQLTMVLCGLVAGDRVTGSHVAGLSAALAGFYVLLFAQGGANYGGLWAQVLMAAAGVAWGVYSILGRQSTHAKALTRGNFIRAAALSATLLPMVVRQWQWDPLGLALATASGALTSGAGYVVWYSVTPRLRAIQASTVQLSVPLITAVAGILFLQENLVVNQVFGGLLILGGIALTFKH
ncbi:DMT family transporter [Ramlibacter tataouinensis]|uniref:DMT family transporter n=1 Tax=Ramlibacter tataouinensis TaxID=94132 RepID=UPI0022F39B70|nr:DMT family transporter [Ramlibacter tataouinensis]WBY02764.1 DMT family transporter [Ramlibacter tataouinensis]